MRNRSIAISVLEVILLKVKAIGGAVVEVIGGLGVSDWGFARLSLGCVRR